MNIYLLSGLGADKRIFSKLSFSSDHQITHVEWISPISSEDLSSYARRLASQIDETKPFVLIGVSFGGMVAIELNKFMNPLQTIIISSASTDAQIPWYYKVVGLFKLYRIVPVKVLKAPTALAFWFFGTKTDEERKLLAEILKDTDGKFLTWAISKITNWSQRTILPNIYHIHGTADRILPLKFLKPNAEVSNGGHLMVFSNHDAITALIAGRIG